MSEDALRNPLVLQKIFQNFPTGFLLSSCSLVNKTWNREARKFVRDHRTCSVTNQFFFRPGLCYCQFYDKLHNLCLRMSQNGRVIPWNTLVMRQRWESQLLNTLLGTRPKPCHRHSRWTNDNDEESDSEIRDPEIDFNLKDHVTFTRLHVGLNTGKMSNPCPSDATCPGFKKLLGLVRENSRGIKSMTIERTDALEILLQDWQPYFPRLEELSIVKGGELTPISTRKEIVQKILGGAPNLKRIDDMARVSLYPEDKFGLFLNLEFKAFTVEEITLLRKIAAKKPRLREIKTLQPVIFPVDGDNEPEDGHPQLERILRIFRRLLRSSVRSLQTVAVVGASLPFDQFGLSPFINLTTLSFKLTCYETAQDFWDAIAAIDYSNQMPKLQRIDVRLSSVWLMDDTCWYCYNQHGHGTCAEWPPASNLDDASFSTAPSIKTLNFDLPVRRVNLTAIRAKFPLINSLNLKMDDSYERMDPTALFQMWGLWPTLEKLELTGYVKATTRCFDADFCGIHEDEAQMLREMSEEYLEAVHIVPIQPSVCTMPNLEKLRIHFRFKDGGHLIFISKVTELVAFKRMKHTEVDVRLMCEAPPRPNPWAFVEQMEYDPDTESLDNFHFQQLMAMERARTPSPPRAPSPRVISFPISKGNGN